MSREQQKVALVTGAASGIGRGCALELARRGYALALVDRDAEQLANLQRELGAHDTRAHAFVVDLVDKAAIERLATDAWEALGAIDLLLNNAGVMYFGPAAQMKLSDWEWIVDVNFWAPIRLTSALLPRMRARRRGHIAVTASTAGLFAFPGFTAYSVTKAAMIAYCEAMRAELAADGISVSAVCPSLVATNIASGGRFASGGDRRNALARFGPGKGMPLDEACRAIVDGLVKREPYVVIGGISRPLWWLDRASPGLAHLIRVQMFKQFERMRNAPA